MTQDELTSLAPYFQEGERFLNGTVIEWTTVSFETMRAVRRVRELLDVPVKLIRGAHPDPDGTKPYKRTAIDACAPGASMAEIAMALFRVQHISFGLYSGNSFHIDTRAFDHEPARWLAIKLEEEALLKERGLSALITSRADGWVYLSWSQAQSLSALVLVCALADAKLGNTTAGG